MGKQWPQAANDFLFRAYPDKRFTIVKMADVLREHFGHDVTPNAVVKQAARLGIRKSKAPMKKPIRLPLAIREAIVSEFKAGKTDAELAAMASEMSGHEIGVRDMARRRIKMGLRRGTRTPWPEEANEVLKEYCAIKPPEWIARVVSKRIGRRVSADAVRSKIVNDGLDRLMIQGDLTIQQAADELGVDRSRLVMFIRRRRLQVYGEGFYRFVPEETMAILHEAFPRITEATMSVPEVAAALFAEVRTVRGWIKRKTMPAVMFGHYYRVPVAAVEAKRRELGITRPLPQTFGRAEQPKRTAS